MREIVKLLGEFEAEKVGVVSRITHRKYDEVLRSFLEANDKKASPKDFNMCDVEDWKGREEGYRSFWKVRYELQVIRMFWNWLRLREEFRELPQIVNSKELEREAWRRRLASREVQEVQSPPTT